MEDKNLVIICIPIYKQELSDTEKISLAQMNKVLGNYQRCFIAPESLQFDYGSDGIGIRKEKFPDYFFKNIKGYSNLLLDVDFYRRFANYEYILIYQLDAFVFKDELAAFCAAGYDYIGAPIAKINSLWHALGARVGNGGLSLRRVSAAIRTLEQWFAAQTEHPLQNLFWQAEDLFWGYCGMSAEFDFRVPTVKEALEFAVQDDVGHVFSRINRGWLPFGCHAWCKDNISFWHSHIEKCGYTLQQTSASAAYRLETGWLLGYMAGRGNVNMFLLWGAWRKDAYEVMLNLLEKWLVIYKNETVVWQGKTEELAYLWLMVENKEFSRKHKIRLQLYLSRAMLLALAAEEPAPRLWYILLSIAVHLEHYDYESAAALRRRISSGFWDMWEKNAIYVTVMPFSDRKKITVVTAVYDDVNTLESFVRHTLSFADNIVCSTTLASARARLLLEKLVSEGLPLTLTDGAIKKEATGDDVQLILELESYDFLLPNREGESVRQLLAKIGINEACVVPVFAYSTWMNRVFEDKFLLAQPLLRSLQAGGMLAITQGVKENNDMQLHIARFAMSEERGRHAGRIPVGMEFSDVSRLVANQKIIYKKIK